MQKSFNERFTLAGNFYNEGRYTDAINLLNEILSDELLKKEEKYETKYLKSLTLTKQKKHTEALEVANSIIKSSENQKLNLFQVDGILAKATVCNDIRDIEASLKLVTKAEKILKSSKTILAEQKLIRESRLLRVKGWGLLYNNQIHESLDYFERRIDLCRKSGDKFEIGIALNDAGIALYSLGEGETALKFYNQSLELFKEFSNKRYISNLYSNIAIIHYQNGELNQALEFSGKCLALREELGEEYDISRINHQLGNIYSQLGNLDKALEHYLRSKEFYKDNIIEVDLSRALLDIHYIYKRKGDFDKALENLYILKKLNEKNKDCQGLGVTHNYIGRIYIEKGELNIAEENYIQALSYSIECKNEDTIADVYYSLGELYYFKSELEESLKNHLLSLDIRERIGFSFQKAYSLKNLVVLHLDLNLADKAKEYQTKLKELADNAENIAIKQMSRLSEALVLINSKTEKSIAKAEFLLEQIIEEEVVDYIITVEALLNLTDLLVDELYITENEDILQEIGEKINNLREISSKQGSYYLEAEILLLQAQLFLLELKIQETLETLSKAQELAESKGIYKLALKISNEHDDILEKLTLWEEFTMRLPTIAEKMELLHIEEQLEKLIKRKQIVLEESRKEEEIPVLIGIFSPEGRIIFVEHIEDTLSQESIDAIFRQIKDEKIVSLKDSIVERVRYNDYTYLLLKEGTIIVCYLYIGKSYLGIKKMKKFVKQLHKHPKLRKTLRMYSEDSKALEFSDRLFITEYIDKAFLAR